MSLITASNTSRMVAGDIDDPEFVYVNGEKLNLLEDGRLSLYTKFPYGTLLFEPSSVPPKEIPLSTDASEQGITMHRLLPRGHYEAYLPDPTTGDLFPLIGEYICAYVSNLPPSTTAEMLGRFFEAFDMVAEADVFTDSTGACTGRGWVVLQDPAKLLLVPTAMEFFPRNFIHIALSDVMPNPAMFQGVCGSWTQPSSALLHQECQPIARNNRRVSGKRVQNMWVGKGELMGDVSNPPPAVDVGVVNTNAYYFVVVVERSEAERSVKSGFFRTDADNKRAFYKAMNKGPVVIIFVVQHHIAIFGFGRLLPQAEIDSDTNMCLIQWMKHGVFLEDSDLRGIQSIPLTKMKDGIPLKPEIGESICYLASGCPLPRTQPEGFRRDQRNGRQPTRLAALPPTRHSLPVARSFNGVVSAAPNRSYPGPKAMVNRRR
uniref:RRM domain-containing protein n=1 Tax=Trypanosoma congolense (strain IL3000) TaxID=1068625 RepID=G0UZ30_TRYCI|nr:conserved hypothetical protein [Trypanosoma congolense IL3000]